MSPLISYRTDDLTVELLAVHDYGRLLAATGARDAEWIRYREWRDRVLSAAGSL